ncbi:hypothetical protein BU24DRAFT_491424 [Aaosphaeria arxii CBS 175.79]|uniref:Uncharacterized protein n=1 Tax=Aaosphaeria arxii CBS 175.79 TaxID=1450172 RepID=A0A6A5XYS5_9PLEO|nr:uncharacterized protein BU24DRAFT_491424 [Aaosphaeria arxii CBS 175.79]KAF2018465.1 hypothetical protein BU24DRAFT_491424 [Aaosphaeria arxii CBS 175.79]
MSKSQRTPIPLPGSTASKKNASAKVPQKGSFKSQEFVESSDESATEQPAKKKAGNKRTDPKSPAKIGVHKPNGVSKKTKVPPPTPISAPKKVVTNDLTTTSSSSESDETAEEVPQQKGVENTGTVEQSDSSSSEDDSDSSSEESENETAPATVRNIENLTSQQPPQQSHTVEFRPAQPYNPPKGFNAIPTPLKATSNASKVFENLEGKQIWHISAPVDISVAQLEQLAMDDALKGKAILKHKGSDYGLVRRGEGEEVQRAVLIPRPDGFKAVSMPITQTFHLQQVLHLPNITTKQTNPSTGSEATRSITSSTIRAPRPQVKGLRMRYWHSGFGDDEPGTIGSSDDETERPTRTPGLVVSNGSQILKKPEKRKHEGANGPSEAPSKKHKKHKTAEEIKKKEEKKAKKDRKRAAEAAGSS